jgi:hypothetical protein
VINADASASPDLDSVRRCLNISRIESDIAFGLSPEEEFSPVLKSQEKNDQKTE